MGLYRFVAIVCLCALPAMAQEIRAGLSGTVLDPQGASVPGVSVEALNLQTNKMERTTTNQSGHYALPVLPIGLYTVTASSAGFKKSVRSGLELRVGDRIQLDFKLELGQIAEQVTVVGEAELLDTGTASRGQVIDSTKIRDLPVLGRNPFMLGGLATGVHYINTPPSRSFRPFDGGADTMAINGGRPGTSAILIDGVPNTATETTGAANVGFVPSPEATQEFKIQTNTYDAEQGRTGGGTISLSLKSGSNQVHGALYLYFRHDKLNANHFQSNAGGVPRSAFRWNQPGVQIDGPVYIPKLYDGRNKTFFMFSWEKIVTSLPSPGYSDVPTPDQRNGIFSTTLQAAGRPPITIYDPFTTVETTPGRYTRQPMQGNMVPRSRMDPVALKMLEYLPQPNVSSAFQHVDNLLASPNPRTDEYDQFVTRLDQVVGQNHRVSGRWVRGNRHEVNSFGGYPEPASNQYAHRRFNWGGSFDVTSTLSPTMVLTTRVGYTQRVFNIRVFSDGFDPALLGFPDSLVSQLPRKFFPRVSIAEYTQFGTGRNGGSEYTTSDTWSAAETLNKTFGAHSTKVGGEFRVMRNNQDRPTSSSGSYDFTRGFTQADPTRSDAASGSAFASFLMGLPSGGSVPWNNSVAYAHRYYGIFAQDDWRVSSRLTLNLGLRWDYESPVTERFNQQNTGFDLNVASPLQVPGYNLRGGLLFADENNRTAYRKDLNNIQPRIGLAWRLLPKTVLRTGYGMSYLPVFAPGARQGFNITTPYISTETPYVPGRNRLSNPYPDGIRTPPGRSLGLATFLGQGVSYTVQERAVPKFHQFSFGFEHELPWRTVFEVSYVGSRTREMGVGRDLNVITTQQWAEYGDRLNSTVTNPFAGLLPGTGLNNPTVQLQQLLRPYPQYTGIDQGSNPWGRAWYNALQVRLEKRLSNGFHGLLSYTYSRTMEATGYLNDQDPVQALAPVLTDNDAPHRLALSAGWQLPTLANSHALLKGAFGGWQLNGITIFQSGRIVGAPGGFESTGIDPSLPEDQRTYQRYFNTCNLSTTGVRQNCASADEAVAWVQRPPFTLRRLSSFLPGVRDFRPATIDFSVFKTFAVRERVKVQFRAEAYNLFNTPWFGGPNTGLGSANAGRVTLSQSNDPRNLQAALRLSF